MIKDGASDDSVAEKIKEQRAAAFRIIGICLGIPPEQFVWEYVDKNKAYTKVGPITPMDFYNEHVKPVFDIEEKVRGVK